MEGTALPIKYGGLGVWSAVPPAYLASSVGFSNLCPAATTYHLIAGLGICEESSAFTSFPPSPIGMKPFHHGRWDVTNLFPLERAHTDRSCGMFPESLQILYSHHPLMPFHMPGYTDCFCQGIQCLALCPAYHISRSPHG